MFKITKTTINIILILIVIGASIALLYTSFKKTVASIKIDSTVFPIEIARTQQDQKKGLGFRDSLKPQTGMLFVFPQSEIQHFCMCDMRFPLDFVWINKNTIIGITENVLDPSKVNGETLLINSPAAADMVLELNAGDVKKYNIQKNTKVFIQE